MGNGIPLSASIPNLVDKKRLTRVNSLNHMITSIASLGGAFIGGIIFVLVDVKLFLLVNGLSFVFSAISEVFIDFEINKKEKTNEEVPVKQKEKSAFFKDLKEGVDYVRGQKWLLLIATLMVSVNIFMMIGITVPMPYIVNEIKGFSSAQYGLLNSVIPLGMLVRASVLSMLPEPESNYKRIIGGVCGYSLGMILMGVVSMGDWFPLTNNEYLIILMCIYGIMAVCCTVINIPTNIAIQKLVPNEMLGRVVSVMVTLGMGLSPLGVILGGWLVDTVDPTLIPTVCGVIMILLCIKLFFSKEIKKI